MPAPKTGFLIISSSENDSIIRGKVDEIFDSNGFNLKDAMNIRGTGNLYCKICERILSSAFGVALITKDTPRNTLPNIFLEIGLLTAFGKEVIILTDSRETIPSDLQGKEVFIFADNNNLSEYINKWSTEIQEKRITYWRTLAKFSVEAKDYEKAYEYLRKAIMFGDFEDSLSELKGIFDECSKGEITISERLKQEIGNFVEFIQAFKG